MSHLSAAAAPRALSARPGLSGTALKTIALVLMVLLGARRRLDRYGEEGNL